MALRQLIRKSSISVWSLTSSNINTGSKDVFKKGNLECFSWRQNKLPSLFIGCKVNRKLNLEPNLDQTQLTSHRNNTFIDLFTNNPYKRLIMPTITVNTLKVYQDIESLPKPMEDNRKIIKIIEPSLPDQKQKKEAIRMIRIRKRKMRKHKRKRFRKKYKFLLAKLKLKKELRKERIFRSEILGQIEAADKFDAKEYVNDILHTLRNHPKPKTAKETYEEFRLKKKLHRYQTNFIRPNFDDD